MEDNNDYYCRSEYAKMQDAIADLDEQENQRHIMTFGEMMELREEKARRAAELEHMLQVEEMRRADEAEDAAAFVDVLAEAWKALDNQCCHQLSRHLLQAITNTEGSPEDAYDRAMSVVKK